MPLASEDIKQKQNERTNEMVYTERAEMAAVRLHWKMFRSCCKVFKSRYNVFRSLCNVFRARFNMFRSFCNAFM